MSKFSDHLNDHVLLPILIEDDHPTEPRVAPAIIEMQVLLHTMLETVETIAAALKATTPTIQAFDAELARRCWEAQIACERISTYIRETNDVERVTHGQD